LPLEAAVLPVILYCNQDNAPKYRISTISNNSRLSYW